MSFARFRYFTSATKQFYFPVLNRFNCAQLHVNPFLKLVNANQNRKFHRTYYNNNGQASSLTQIGQSKVPVEHFGCFYLNTLFVDLAIKPIDLEQYPNMDIATCSYLSTSLGENGFPVLSETDGKLCLISDKVYEPSTSQCAVEIPLKYDVHLQDPNGKNDINIRSMESTLIDILTGSGNISSKSLKGDVIDLKSQSGNINCQGVTQGKISFQSESGDIHGHRFQGPYLEIKTATGSISTESVYSDVSSFSSHDGNINLKNLHRQSKVEISGKGNLVISGMDGSLDAILGNGTHQIQISQLHDASSLKVKNGTLLLRIPEKCPFGIRIRAKSLTVPEVMKKLMKDENGCMNFEYMQEQQLILDIDATDSCVEVQFQDWLASLGFNFR